MNFTKRKQSFIKLADILNDFNQNLIDLIEKSYIHNGWYLPSFSKFAIQQICSNLLTEPAIDSVSLKYPFVNKHIQEKTIGVIMAGNIPLVGFHDFFCTLLAGHKINIKLSSKDTFLMPYIIDQLILIEPAFKNYININERLNNCDAYIATGSNNTSRYFEYYFAKYPNIIRNNKTSIAILDGHESQDELNLLADDIFLYFGLGCRNVSCIFIPENYSFDTLINTFKKYDYVKNINKYINNLDYQYALSLMNKDEVIYLDNLLIKRSDSIFSPISVLHYQYYQSKNMLQSTLNYEHIQCIISKDNIKFGFAQSPSIFDFADGIDTFQFLEKIS